MIYKQIVKHKLSDEDVVYAIIGALSNFFDVSSKQWCDKWLTFGGGGFLEREYTAALFDAINTIPKKRRTKLARPLLDALLPPDNPICDDTDWVKTMFCGQFKKRFNQVKWRQTVLLSSLDAFVLAWEQVRDMYYDYRADRPELMWFGQLCCEADMVPEDFLDYLPADAIANDKSIVEAYKDTIVSGMRTQNMAQIVKHLKRKLAKQ